MTSESIVSRIQSYLRKTGREHGLMDEVITVSARPLSPEEAIGNPEHDDYPLVKGRERMMEAVVRGAKGHAFTDMHGRWEGPFRDVCDIEPANNFRRAILTATLNAVMRLTGEADRTVHCRDEGPVECAGKLPSFIEEEGLEPPFVLIGYQPRFAEALSKLGELRIVDMDIQHIGQVRAGVTVYAPEQTEEALNGAGSAFVTGSTIVNNTIDRFMDLKIPTVFFGVTVSGVAELLGLKRYCTEGF